MTCLMNETEAAKILGVRVHKLRRDRMTGGGVPFVKMQAAVRYSSEAIQKYIQSRTRKSTSDQGNKNAT